MVLVSKFDLSSSVITPQVDVVAAGKDVLLPEEDSIIKDEPVTLFVKFVLATPPPPPPPVSSAAGAQAEPSYLST